MPAHNKLGAVVALIAIGLSASLGLAWPARDVSLYGLTFTLSGKMLLGLILFGLTCTGADMIVRGHPKIQPQQLHLTFLHWILPAALTTIAWALLAWPGSLANKIIGVMVTGGLLALLISAEYYTVDLTERWRVAVQFSLRLMAYLLAALLYTTIHLSISAGLSATIAVAMVGGVLSLKLLCDNECPLQRIWPYVLSIGALLGVMSWLLSLRTASPLLHSLVLAVLLYVLTGIARQFLLGKLTRRVALEYLLVGAFSLLLLHFYAR